MTKKQLIISGSAILLLALSAWLAFAGPGGNNGAGSEQNQPSNQPSQNNETPADNDGDGSDQESSDQDGGEHNPKVPTDDTNQDSAVKPVITRISQDAESVTVKAYVNTFNEGTCVLTMTKNTSLVTKESGTTFQPSYLLCSGFEVAKSELSAGTWTVSVSYKIDNATYVSDESTVTIN